jgi:hypothetical protein
MDNEINFERRLTRSQDVKAFPAIKVKQQSESAQFKQIGL